MFIVSTIFTNLKAAVRSYTQLSVFVVCINLVREIRDRSIFVSGFDLSELNQIICAL